MTEPVFESLQNYWGTYSKSNSLGDIVGNNMLNCVTVSADVMISQTDTWRLCLIYIYIYTFISIGIAHCSFCTVGFDTFLFSFRNQIFSYRLNSNL